MFREILAAALLIEVGLVGFAWVAAPGLMLLAHVLVATAIIGAHAFVWAWNSTIDRINRRNR
jgi:hypothetical protein